MDEAFKWRRSWAKNFSPEVVMDADTRKPRRTESSEERVLRFDKANREAMDRALAEQDQIDASIRRSIEEHGA